MEPKRPSDSSFGPAVKNNVLVGPLFGEPWPNWSAQRPSIVSDFPSTVRSSPRCSKCPFASSSYALICPSPKFPTRRSPLKRPKSDGARTTVWLPCDGCQPRICPASVAKTKIARAVTDQKTAPVGWPGTCTTSDLGVPSAPYSVDRLVPLSATHHGVVGPAVRPQPLTRFGSKCAAAPGTFEASAWTV